MSEFVTLNDLERRNDR